MDKKELLKIKALTKLLSEINLPKEHLEEAFVTTLYKLMGGNEVKIVAAISALEILVEEVKGGK